MKWILLAIAAGLLAVVFRRRQPGVRDRHHYRRAGKGDMDDFAPAMEVNDSPVVRTVNEILHCAKEHGASKIRIDAMEQEDGKSGYAARYFKGEEVVHNLPLQIEERDKITQRLKLISGINPLPSPKLEEGRIKLKSGAIVQEFLVEFHPEEAGGEIFLTVKGIADSDVGSA